jgi:DNA polymerase
VNIRDEAVLRELNLYPLWVRREMPAPEADVGAATAVGATLIANREETNGMEGDARAAFAAEAHPVPVEVTAPTVEVEDAPLAAAVLNVAPSAPTRPQQGGGSVPAAAVEWPELKQQVHDCTACKLRAGCTQTVFGVGDEQAEWLFVGEGPGADEDARGEPFVGQAGKLLDNMLASIKLKRGNNVYIANIVKCRPPNNRTPEADEIATCLPYLQQQIALIKPKLIVALGKTAATSLLGRDATLGSLRGTLHDYHGIPLIVTFHPAYLLRSPAEKAKAWQDLCFAVQRMTE